MTPKMDLQKIGLLAAKGGSDDNFGTARRNARGHRGGVLEGRGQRTLQRIMHEIFALVFCKNGEGNLARMLPAEDRGRRTR